MTTACGNKGQEGLARAGTPGAVIGTTWNTPDIWLRREVTLPDGIDPANIQLRVYHDEDIEVYIDGELAAGQSGYVTAYDLIEIRPTRTQVADARQEDRTRGALPSNRRRAGGRRRSGRRRRNEPIEERTPFQEWVRVERHRQLIVKTHVNPQIRSETAVTTHPSKNPGGT